MVRQMTLTEKIGQLVQLAGSFYKDLDGEITGPMAAMGVSDTLVSESGSVLGASGAAQIREMQKTQMNRNRWHIPVLVMADVVHGYKTIFPIPLAIGCSWNPLLAEESASVAAREAAVSGVHVVFAPMADLVRDPRWGRVMESTGEDPFLNSVFARAFVEGLQGRDLKHDTSRVAACVKHFAAYGAAEGGREYNTVDLSEWRLRQEYLPSYRAAVDAGCRLVMTSFNTVQGVPSTGNQWLLRHLLREEWQFDGVVISDWGAVHELIPHGVAADESEAAEKAIRAGVDIEMMSLCYPHQLKSLVLAGRLSESLIDQAVLRILKLKDGLGLFDNPYRGADEAKEEQIVLCPAHREVAEKLAEESCVLLKNDDVLPLNGHVRIALIGPFADSGDILGSWSWKGNPGATETLRDVLGKESEFDLSFARGSGIDQSDPQLVQEAVKLAGSADVIILAVGESPEMSGEASSRTQITLPECQQELFTALMKTGRPIVTVLFNGRPLVLGSFAEQSNAILEAWFPGTEGARAITRLLTGKAGPSGKLSISFPRSVGQIPVYYNRFNTGRPENENPDEHKYVSRYIDSPNEPFFPFGYGLSYTRFKLNNLVLSANRISAKEVLTVTVTLENIGNRDGMEVVQLYLRDLAADVVRPIKELKAFQKVHLESGEIRTLQFFVSEPMLRYYHADLSDQSDPGRFEVMVGTDSVQTLNMEFVLEKTSEVTDG